MRAEKIALPHSGPRAGTEDMRHMLEQRLNLLVHSLNTAEVTEKSMDMVKEIKELYAILNVPSAKDDTAPRPLLVGWSAPAAPCRNNGELP